MPRRPWSLMRSGCWPRSATPGRTPRRLRTNGHRPCPTVAASYDDRDTLVAAEWDGRIVQAYFQDGSYVSGNLEGFDVVANYRGGTSNRRARRQPRHRKRPSAASHDPPDIERCIASVGNRQVRQPQSHDHALGARTRRPGERARSLKRCSDSRARCVPCGSSSMIRPV
jgi:hypothetical protein